MWVSQDTAASSPGSSEKEDTVQGEWCVPLGARMPPNLPQWSIDYFELKLIEKQLAEKKSDLISSQFNSHIHT